jgi:hypothetical protein
VYAHIYCHHLPDVLSHGGEAHVNSALRFFASFARCHSLVSEEELAPLKAPLAALGG